MSLIRNVLLCGILASSATAQQMTHSLSAERSDLPSAARPRVITADTMDVLAAMIQFQVDNDTRTSGDGRFVLSSPNAPIIDAPPHNRQYFEDHLTFLTNYYRKVSKGLLHIRWTVVDSIFTLPTVMASYSPPRGGSDSVVANLARDTWQLVNASGLVPDFSIYESFVVFHAGVGRDIDLASELGFDPTPFDIPSLFFSLSSLRAYYGQTFQGFPVNGGFVTNSAILPETENRLIPTATGDFLLELSTNGLLCASIGSYLGLPDLFNTRTGESGIGRFGLMDGQAIFSFSGVFPPEPSAWEKYWLGWISPETMTSLDSIVTLPAVGQTGETQVFRIPISQTEYYLVENRSRDPQQNGQRVSSRFNGSSGDQFFRKDTIGFNAFDISALSGVVVDVEDIDWSLPGGVDEAGTFFDGGIIVWHIDEAVIGSSVASNSVNADPARRGVDVEEADGSQDIGQRYGFLSPGSGSEDGTALDFWYQGNSSPVYRNRFDHTTHPNTLSNSLAASHITLEEFSARDSVMTARIKVGTTTVALLDGYPQSLGELLPQNPLTLTPSAGGFLVTTTGLPPLVTGSPSQMPASSRPGGKVFALSATGTPLVAGAFSNGLVVLTDPTGVQSLPVLAGPVVAELSGVAPAEFFVVHQGEGSTSVLKAYTTLAGADSLASPYFSLTLGQRILTSPVVGDSMIALGGEWGRLYLVRFNGTIVDSTFDLQESVVGICRFVGGNRFVVTGRNGRVTILGDGMPAVSTTIGHPVGSAASTATLTGVSDAAVALGTLDGLLYLFDGNLNAIRGFPVTAGGGITSPPVLADINGDGSRDVVVTSGDAVVAFNRSGAVMDNFPVRSFSGRLFSSHPIVGDADGDGDADIMAATEDGVVHAFDMSGRMAMGFPLQAGSGESSLGVFNVQGSGGSSVALVVLSQNDGSINAWKLATSTPPIHPWAQYQRNEQRGGMELGPLSGSPLSQDFLPSTRAYNWPNPVYDDVTQIRFFVSDDASVNVRVYDVAGDLVDELNGYGIGGLDNEISWNVEKVQSGVYFARIEASGAGKNGVAIIKVAVVK